MFTTETNVGLGRAGLDKYFPNVLHTSEAANGDNTLLAVLRVLLTEERTEGKTGLYVAEFNKTAEFSALTEDEVKENIIKSDFWKELHDSLAIITVTGAGAEDYCKAVRKFESGLSGYKRIEDLSLYIDRTNIASLYQNDERKMTIVFAPKSQAPGIFHMIASAMPRVMPWLFEKNPLSESEIALLRSLAQPEKNEDFIAAINAIETSMDFRSKEIATMFDNFCSSDLVTKIDEYDSSILDLQRSIESRYDDIRRMNRDIEDYMTKLVNMRNKQARGEKEDIEVVEYLKSAKNIDLLKRERSDIYFAITSNLDQFDEDMFDSCVMSDSGRQGYVFSNSSYEEDTTRNLLKAIFIDHRFSLKAFSIWKMRTDAKVYPISKAEINYSDYSELMGDSMPNPHIYHFACVGGYRSMFEDARARRDYTAGIMTAVRSAGSINWVDSTVIAKFIQMLFKNEYKCLVDNKTGTHLYAKEAIAILKKEGKK